MRSKLVIATLTVAVAFLLATNPVVSEAAGQITGKQIKDDSIKGKDIKESTLATVPSATSADTAKTAGTATTATSAVTANSANTAASVGPLAATQVQDKASILFGTVEPLNATPGIKKARGVVAVERNTTGYYDVKFNRDVSGCTWAATYGSTAGGVGPRFATTRANTSHPGDPSWISVVVFNDAGAQADGEGFSVLALCP